MQMQDLLRTILDSAGYEVRVTPGGKKGMKDCESSNLGHAITDGVVPHLDWQMQTPLAKGEAVHLPESAKQTKQNCQSCPRKSGAFAIVIQQRSTPMYRQLPWSISDE